MPRTSLPGRSGSCLQRLFEHFKELGSRRCRSSSSRSWPGIGSSEPSRKLEKIPGIGPLTASALVAAIGDAKSFETGGSWPRGWDWCRGSTPAAARTLLGISKRGDAYLRTLLIHGARAVIRFIERKPEQADAWLRRLTGTAQPEHRGRGAGEQECADRVGAACARA